MYLILFLRSDTKTSISLVSFKLFSAFFVGFCQLLESSDLSPEVVGSVLMLCNCSLIAMLSMSSPLHFFSIDFLFLLKVFLKVCQSTLIFVIGGIDRKDLLSHTLAEVSRLKSYTIKRAVFIQLETKSKEVYKLRFVWDALCCFHLNSMIKNKQFGQRGSSLLD